MGLLRNQLQDDLIRYFTTLSSLSYLLIYNCGFLRKYASSSLQYTHVVFHGLGGQWFDDDEDVVLLF